MTKNKWFAPHIRTEERSYRMMLDVLLAATPLCVLAAVNYGMRPVWIVLLTILTAIISECICCLFRHKSFSVILDGSAAVTGAIIGLVMSPMVAYWVPMLAAAFAIFVVKAPFGGYGRNVFNPAAAGLAVVSYCFPTRLFSYPNVSLSTTLPLDFSISKGSIVTEASLAAQLRSGAHPSVNLMDLLVGDFSGPIGATATVILLACGIYLIWRRSASLWTTLPYLVTCTLVAWLSPRAGLSGGYSIAVELCSGYVLFTGIFLLNDPVTTPHFWLGRIVYGVLTGLMVMLLQHIGRAEAGSCFAILIMNVLSPIIDRWSWHVWRYLTQFRRLRKEMITHE